jgi:RNA polymerase sigma factor for flagellar operon FliA
LVKIVRGVTQTGECRKVCADLRFLESFMVPMHGVPSALIARNESWVRQQAQALVRHLPANVEKADLIQVGLIAVAQAALSFVWEGEDRESEEAEQAFVKYARHRVRGAMLDELRQMDHLGRAQRRKVKVVQIARERWRSIHGKEPMLADLAPLTGLTVEEIAQLDQAERLGRSQAGSDGGEGDEVYLDHLHPATPKEEVEARVDTGIVMRHLERFFAQLPERERRVIDAYLGIGLTPVQLAQELKVSPSRVSQIYKALLEKMARHFGHHRSTDRLADAPDRFDDLVAQREAELEASATEGPWGEMVEEVLTLPRERFGDTTPDVRLQVTSTTRWG